MWYCIPADIKDIAMADFEHTFTRRSDKKQFAAALLNYYLYIYAPRMITMFTVSLFWIFLCMTQFAQDLRQVMIMIAGVGFACMIFEFPVFMYRVFKVVTPMGTFEKDTYFHFYANKLLCRCGENENVTEYRTVSGYFRFRKRIFLLVGGQMFFAVFSESLFDDKINDFISALADSGVKKVKFFSPERWGVSLGFIILCAVALLCAL